MKAKAALLGLALMALFPSVLAAHVDGMSLSVSLGTGPGQVTLDWSGGQPSYHVYRSTLPANLTAPGNLIGSTQVRTFSDAPGLGGIFFYMLTSDCQYAPPEVCDGLDNDCNGSIDGPGSEISCNLPNAVPQCTNGSCAIAGCASGFGDCDTIPTDGCESDLSSDPNHCGTCAISCADPVSCTVDSCAASSCHHLDLRACLAAPTTGEGGVGCASSPQSSGCWGGCSAAEGVVPLPPGCSNPDSDGDGLSDNWESSHGVDGNCDGDLTDTGLGGMDVALPDDPDWDEVTQKNAYVVYDWMMVDPSDPFEAQHQPMANFTGKDYDGVTDAPVEGALPRLVDAFALKGIRLKMEPNTHPSRIGPGNSTGVTSPLPHVEVVSFANPIGECATNGGTNTAVSLYDLKGQNFDSRRRFTHKYAVFGHSAHCSGNCDSAACVVEGQSLGLCGPVGEGTTGLAEVMGNDILITLGGQGLDDGSTVAEPLKTMQRDRLIRYQAGTAMHELGHTFGLDHGGANSGAGCNPGPDSGINRKPNYISSMQYALQLNGIRTAPSDCSTTPLPPVPPYAQFDPGAWRVDYSPVPPPVLDENSLLETEGISPCVCGATSGLRDISVAYANCFGAPVPVPGCGPVDWNQNGFIEPIPVAVDINRDSLDDPAAVCPDRRPLSGFDDWSFVSTHLAFQCGTNFSDGAAFHFFPSTPELHAQMIGAMGQACTAPKPGLLPAK